MMVTRQKDKRTHLIQLIHIGCAKVGLSDESAKDFKKDHTGKSSCSEMTIAELESVLNALKNAGFVVANQSGKKKMPVTERDRGYATDEQLEYIKGLWELAARIKTDAALESFVRRLIHVDAIRFMDERGATKVILALRSMATKAGYDPDSARGRFSDGR